MHLCAEGAFVLLAYGVDLLRVLVSLSADSETVPQSKQALSEPFIDGVALSGGYSTTRTGEKH